MLPSILRTRFILVLHNGRELEGCIPVIHPTRNETILLNLEGDIEEIQPYIQSVNEFALAKATNIAYPIHSFHIKFSTNNMSFQDYHILESLFTHQRDLKIGISYHKGMAWNYNVDNLKRFYESFDQEGKIRGDDFAIILDYPGDALQELINVSHINSFVRL